MKQFSVKDTKTVEDWGKVVGGRLDKILVDGDGIFLWTCDVDGGVKQWFMGSRSVYRDWGRIDGEGVSLTSLPFPPTPHRPPPPQYRVVGILNTNRSCQGG